ncbi:MAG: hypothetical protein N2053_07835, partial [Chitinispirillaceae bacterium]|nr:hypothetical protein [Chitinispirillaceae bacterium]
MNSIDQRNRFDFTIFFISIILWIIGILLVYSATSIHESGFLAGLYKQQIIWVVLGVAIILIIVSIPGRLFYDFSYPEMLIYRKPPKFYSEEEIKMAVEEPVIIHYTTSFLSN